MNKKDEYSAYELVRSGLIGFGAAVTLNRLEAAIRPNKRFAISEIGILAFTAYVFVHVADKALAELHKEKKKKKELDKKTADQIKNFGEWLKAREKAEENAAETFTQYFKRDKDVKESEGVTDGEQ